MNAGGVVFEAVFRGDLFRIEALSNKQYLFEQVADDGGVVKSGIADTLQDALNELHQQINSWAVDIDAGVA